MVTAGGSITKQWGHSAGMQLSFHIQPLNYIPFSYIPLVLVYISHTRHNMYMMSGHLCSLCLSSNVEFKSQPPPAGIRIIESTVLSSLSIDLIRNTELLMEDSSPGIW